MELSTYFRINAENTGQFERTLIIADKGSYVSYLEGCTAPKRDTHQLHAAVVEIVILDDAEVKYSTVQNWYPGDENGVGGIYNFVTKRADCRGARAKVMWTQVETGSAITWKYPSCILRGDDSQGEFYSIAIANNAQQADTGTKMVHLGKNTKSRIVSKGISAGRAQNTYRGLVSMHPKATNSRNYTQCDSLLIGQQLRGAYGALHRGEEQLEPGRARGDDQQGRRRPAVLLPLARDGRGRGGGAGRERLRQGRAADPADGIRDGSAGAGGDQPGRLRRMILTTTPSVEGFQIAEYLGIVAGEAILGANIVRDVFAGLTDIFGGRSGAYEQQLGLARETALREMEQAAAGRGATAVVGVDLDYEVINGMLMVTASGTAVRLG